MGRKACFSLLLLLALSSAAPAHTPAQMDDDESFENALAPSQMDSAVSQMQDMNRPASASSLMPSTSGEGVEMGEPNGFDDITTPFNNMEGEVEAVGVKHPDNTNILPIPKTTKSARTVLQQMQAKPVNRVSGAEVDGSMPGSAVRIQHQTPLTMEALDDDDSEAAAMQVKLQTKGSLEQPSQAAASQMNSGMDELDTTGSADPSVMLSASEDRMNTANIISNGDRAPTHPTVTSTYSSAQFEGDEEGSGDSMDMNATPHSNGSMMRGNSEDGSEMEQRQSMMTQHAISQSQLHAAIATSSDDEDEVAGGIGVDSNQPINSAQMNTAVGHAVAEFNNAGRNPESMGESTTEAVDSMNVLQESSSASDMNGSNPSAKMPSTSAPHITMPPAPLSNIPQIPSDDEMSPGSVSSQDMESYTGDANLHMGAPSSIVMPSTTKAHMREGDNRGPLNLEDATPVVSVVHPQPVMAEPNADEPHPMYFKGEQFVQMNKMDDGAEMGNAPTHVSISQSRMDEATFMDGPNAAPDNFMTQMNTVTKGLDMMSTVASFIEMQPSIVQQQYGSAQSPYAQPLVLPGSLMPIPSHPYGVPYFHRDPLAPLQTPYYHIPSFDTPQKNPALTPYYNPYVNPPPPVPPSVPAAPSFFPYHHPQAIIPPYFPYPAAPVIQPAPFPPYALPSHIEPGKLAPSAQFSHLPSSTHRRDPF